MKYRTRDDIKNARELISPPGDTLIETIEFRGMSQKELASRMGRPDKTINEIIKGKAAITPETALQLQRVLGVPAEFWMERERNYRLELAAIQDSENLLNEEEWAKNFPVREMIRLNWIDKHEDTVSLIDNMLSYFSVANTSSFHNFYENDLYSTAIKFASKDRQDTHALSAWLRKGDLQATEFRAANFRKSEFLDALQVIKNFMEEDDVNMIIGKILEHARDCGVKIVFTDQLSDVNVIGSARWLNDHPLIQMRCRYDSVNQFWKTFYHEAGHIVLHGRKELFVDDAEFPKYMQPKEKEANDFYRKKIIGSVACDLIDHMEDVNHSAIVSCAEELKLHPSFVAHRLKFKKKISEKTVRSFDKPVVLKPDSWGVAFSHKTELV